MKVIRNVKVNVIERTSSGARFLELKGRIIKQKDQYIYIKNYVINIENIVKLEEI